MVNIRAWSKAHGRLAAAWAAIVVVGTVVRWPSMSYALTEAHTFRQTFTTIAIREYMERGLWQLSPVPVFGPPWQLPTELPLYQWLAAIAGDLVGTTPQIAGRFTAYGLFILTSLLAAYLATRWFSRATGVVTLVLLQFLPFAIQWGNAPLIEFLGTSAALAALVCLEHWRGRPRWWLIVASSIAMVIAFTVKPSTALAWLPVYLGAGLAWSWRDAGFRRDLSRWPLAIPVVVGGLAGIAWNRFADSYKLDSPYTAWLATSNLREWYYGTVDQRLDSATWQMIASYSEAIVGSLVLLAILAVAAFAAWPRRAVTAGLVLAFPVAAAVFTNVYYMHNYYQAAVLPALVMVMAAGACGLARFVAELPGKAAIIATTTATVLAVAWLSGEGKLVSERDANGLYEFPLAAEMAAVIPEGSGVIMVGCDWDSTYFYLSGTRGLMVRDDMLSRPIPSEWIGRDLQYLVTCRPDADTSRLLPLNTRLEALSGSISRIASQ